MKTKLNEQIGFIRRSCEVYDDGDETEAIRIANHFRTVFHDSPKTKRSNSPKKKSTPSISLMSHLGLREGLILSSNRGRGDQTDYLKYRFALDKPIPAKMVPILGNHFREIRIVDWWDNETILVHDGNSIPRRKLILDIANKDGGSHVDERLPKYYASLVKGDQSIGIKIEGLSERVDWVTFEEGETHFALNTHYALVRQFAHEFLASVEHFGWRGR